MKTDGRLLSFLFILPLLISAHGWDTEELELFDIVEDVNQNFYDLIGVSQDATASEIKRAYRKLSLQLHPDKNKEADAEIKFRQLVAVYEVLKDDTKREMYNNVLVNGLPDWRQPVYYYRRVRKMGLLELAILLMIIFTVGHFLVIWSVYLERRFEQEEVFRSKKKKEKKSKKARQQQQDEMEELLQEHLETIPRPKFTDVLPIKMLQGLIFLFKATPDGIVYVKLSLQQMTSKHQEEKNEEETNTESSSIRPHRRRVVTPDADFRPEMSAYQAPVSYVQIPHTDVKSSSPNQTQNQVSKQKDRDWTDEDLALLAKAITKFPGGTSQRWEKVAEFVDRPEKEVIKMANKVKEGYVRNVDKAAQGITGALDEDILIKKGKTRGFDDNIISTRNSDWSESDSNAQTNTNSKSIKRNTKSAVSGDTSKISNETGGSGKPVVVLPTSSGDNTPGYTSVDDSTIWTQNQQKILEWCLTQYPKGTDARWEKIAKHIPGKTKEDCLSRVKYLAEMVRQKKQQVSQQS